MELSAIYERIALIHGFTGLVATIAMISALSAIALGNKNPGQRLLTAVFAAQFLLSAYICMGEATSDLLPKGSGRPLVGVAVVSLVLAILMGITLIRPEGEWAVRSETTWKNWIGGALIFWGLIFPPFTDGLMRIIFFSPAAAIPHPTLIVAGAVAWLSMPNTPRLAGWGLALGALILGGLDVMAGVTSSWVLIGLAGLFALDLIRGSIAAGGVLKDDEPPVEKEKRERTKRFVKEKTEPERRWKLK